MNKEEKNIKAKSSQETEETQENTSNVETTQESESTSKIKMLFTAKDCKVAVNSIF